MIKEGDAYIRSNYNSPWLIYIIIIVDASRDIIIFRYYDEESGHEMGSMYSKDIPIYFEKVL